MKRSEMLSKIPISNLKDVRRETAFHEAGHATAIYFGNKQQELPAIFFDIYIDSEKAHSNSSTFSKTINNQFAARLEGGRLISMLPMSFASATRHMSTDQIGIYERAIKADIMNILAGPLAEAKYVSLRDGELINHRLVGFDSLHFYGGLSDYTTINEYLDFWINDETLRIKTIQELTQNAYHFINNGLHWYCISTLSDYILNSKNTKIGYQEISEILDNSRRRYCLSQRLRRKFL